MNLKNKRVLAEFAPETKFEVRPRPASPFRWAQETQFEKLKGRLLAERLENAFDATAFSGVRRAANEAAEIAKLTGYPLLVFPALFEEKAASIPAYSHPLTRIRQRASATRTV